MAHSAAQAHWPTEPPQQFAVCWQQESVVLNVAEWLQCMPCPAIAVTVACAGWAWDSIGMLMGAAATDWITSTSHASTLIARRRRERASWRRESLMTRAYWGAFALSTLEVGLDSV